MNRQPENIEALVAAYLIGEATPVQAMALDAWRQSEPENERYFIQICILYGKNPGHFTWNADAAWELTRPQDNRVIPLNRTRIFSKRNAFRVAAGISLIAALALTLYTLLSPQTQTYFAEATTEQKTDTLPGNHIVAIHKGSSINYERRGKAEMIKLNGNAWFDLNSKEGVTTIVQTGSLQIQDIGTSFGVSTLGDSTIVLVTEGSVQMFTESDPGILLTAGQTGFYVASNGAIAQAPSAAPQTYEWYNRNFHFHGATLAEVVRRVNTAYRLQLELAGPVGDCRITASFYDEPIESIADVLAETLGLTLIYEPGKIVLKGESCEK